MSCGSGDCSTCEVSENRGCGVSGVFDWLYQIEGPKSENDSLVEVQFKGDRKDFYINDKSIDITNGDIVVVEVEKSGYDIGKVSMKGELVALQIARKNRDREKKPLRKIYRIASKNDIKKWDLAVKNENKVLEKAKRIIERYNLQMKLSDVEFQGDNTKATFYYTAEKRIDFRSLIREYSFQFGVNIEMRHIGARQEAAKIGGIGSCGRELCCSTWMTEFPSVSTSAARYQQLAINPQKISGQCGRLKCCLNFELDGYTEALKDFPSSKIKLKSKAGAAKFVKLDVFKRVLFYLNLEAPTSDLLEISVDNVKKIIQLNEKGVFPENFSGFIVEEDVNLNYEDLIGQESINRFDQKGKKEKRNRSQRREHFKKMKAKANKNKKNKKIICEKS